MISTVLLFSIYFIALTWLILFKLQFSINVIDGGRVINLVPFRGSLGENGLIRFSEIRNNIIAFIPFGIYLCMLKSNWSFLKKLIVIAASTTTFEAVQFIFIIGRADITDVLSNTLGGIVGIGLYALLFRLMKGKTDQVIMIAATILTLCALLVVALLLLSNRWIRIQ